jgi:hypothetical protein
MRGCCREDRQRTRVSGATDRRGNVSNHAIEPEAIKDTLKQRATLDGQKRRSFQSTGRGPAISLRRPTGSAFPW